MRSSLCFSPLFAHVCLQASSLTIGEQVLRTNAPFRATTLDNGRPDHKLRQAIRKQKQRSENKRLHVMPVQPPPHGARMLRPFRYKGKGAEGEGEGVRMVRNDHTAIPLKTSLRQKHQRQYGADHRLQDTPCDRQQKQQNAFDRFRCFFHSVF